MKQFLLALVFSICALPLIGCAGTQETQRPVAQTTRDGDRVSTIPWNRPQGWEGTGALGPLSNQFEQRR